MNNNINNILEKYWNAETSLSEEAQLRAYFASNDVSMDHQVYAGLFLQISNERNITTNIDISKTLTGINNIEDVLNKYWEAETSVEDEKLLKRYFNSGEVAPEHEAFKSLFSFYNVAGRMTMETEFNAVNSANDINDILSRYLDAETTIEEESVLKQYFNSPNVSDEHQEYKPLFVYFEDASEMTIDIDIASVLSGDYNQVDNLLEKYWEAETSLSEEKVLSNYFSSDTVEKRHLEAKSLFFYYSNLRNIESEVDIESVLMTQSSQNGSSQSDDSKAPSASKTKVFSIRKFASAIAAIFVLGFAAVTVMNQSTEADTQYKGKYVQLDEEAEAQEAYEITKQAFALLSKKMNKGSKTVKKSMKKAENASIFK